MKAVHCPQYGPPELLEIREMPKPVPQEQEILIRVHATTVAVADSRLRALRVPRGLKLPVRLAMGWNGPKHTVLGVELAGTVASVGSAVTRFQPGDFAFVERH